MNDVQPTTTNVHPIRRHMDNLIKRARMSQLTYRELVRETKKRYIETVIVANEGNLCRAAKELEMHRNTLSRTIGELEIDLESLRGGRYRYKVRRNQYTTAKRPPSVSRIPNFIRPERTA